VKKDRTINMKTITSAVLGLSLTLASAGLTFAAQNAPAGTDNNAPVAKKHVKKNKKGTKNGAAPATTPAPAPASK
jgi:hypothetical protein